MTTKDTTYRVIHRRAGRQFSVLSFQFSVLSCQCSVFSVQSSQSPPREGEAPAEPDVSAQESVFSNRKVRHLGRARLTPSRTSVLSNQCSVIAKSTSGGRGSRRAGQPLGRARLPPSRHPLGRARLPPSRTIQRTDKHSAQRELRPPRIAVNNSDNAVCSSAQDFALSLFWPRKNAEKRGMT